MNESIVNAFQNLENEDNNICSVNCINVCVINFINTIGEEK